MLLSPQYIIKCLLNKGWLLWLNIKMQNKCLDNILGMSYDQVTDSGTQNVMKILNLKKKNTQITGK